MNMSEKLTPTQVFSKIQKNIHVPKGQRNTFGNYNFRSCEDILEAFKEMLKKVDPDNRVSLILSEDVSCIQDRFYFVSTATITIDGVQFSNKSMAREPVGRKGMDDSQISGATISYARKYALAGLLGLDDEKDADNKPPIEKHPEPINYKHQPNTSRPASDAQKKAVFAIAKNRGEQPPNIESMTFDQASNYIKEGNKK
jgi:hypothetical protein